MANDILGPVGAKEDNQITDRLGGVRDNRLFAFFGLHAGERKVTIAHREAVAKRTAKKSAASKAEIVAPSVRRKVIKKCNAPSAMSTRK